MKYKHTLGPGRLSVICNRETRKLENLSSTEKRLLSVPVNSAKIKDLKSQQDYIPHCKKISWKPFFDFQDKITKKETSHDADEDETEGQIGYWSEQVPNAL